MASRHRSVSPMCPVNLLPMCPVHTYPTGALKKQYGAQTYPVEYTYDAQGRMKTLKTWKNFASNSGAAVTTSNYDPQTGFLTQKVYADGQGPTYTYTAGGRLRTRTWTRGIVTTYGTNSCGEICSVDYSDSTPDFSGTFDRMGRIASIHDAIGDRVLAYKPYGELESESITSSLIGNASVGYGFDSLLRVTSITSTPPSPNGASTVAYTYDGASRLKTVTSGTVAASYDYYPDSDLTQTIMFSRNGTSVFVDTRAYDALNRITSIQAGSFSATAYTYNAANQRVKATAEDGRYWQYGYDSLGQVISGTNFFVSGSSVPSERFAYAYDDIGNRTATNVNGRSTAYHSNNLNQYTDRDVPGAVDVVGSVNPGAKVLVNDLPAYQTGSYWYQMVSTNNSGTAKLVGIEILAGKESPVGSGSGTFARELREAFVPKTPEVLAYDADGNLTADGRWTYTWDGENRLVGMEATSTAVAAGAKPQRLTFAYDASGRRMRKIVEEKVNGTWTTTLDRGFLYDQWNLISEYSVSGTNWQQTYTWGRDISGSRHGAGGVGGLLASKSSSGTSLYCYDGNGNVTSLVDALGGKTADYEYGPFGEVVADKGLAAMTNPFRFSTKYADMETVLTYYGHRFYQPQTGRWVSRDPIEESGGQNVYGMLANDANDGCDLFGLISPKCLEAILAAIKQANLVDEIWSKYDPLRDSVSWFTRIGNKWQITQPGGHYKKLREAQKGLQNRVKDAYDKCKDDCPPGSASKVPGKVRELAYRPIPEPLTFGSCTDTLLTTVPGSDADWQNIEMGLAITGFTAGAIATGGLLLDIGAVGVPILAF